MLKRLWRTRPYAPDLGLLLLRVSVSLLLMQYGWEKLTKYNEWSADFPDPLHVTPPISLALTIFAELFCSCFLLFGLFTRIVLIPLMFTMLTLVFIVHANDPFRIKEHAVSFLVPYIALFLTGPGRYSLDHQLKR